MAEAKWRLMPGMPATGQPLPAPRPESERPERVIFGRTDIKTCDAARVTSLVEASMRSQKSTARALKFTPYEGDVIVAVPPRSGEGILLCMLQLLSLGEGSVDATGHRPAGVLSEPVPCIEDPFFDDDPRSLEELQGGTLRLYKTHLPCAGVRDKLSSAGKFITIVRDPKDYRLAWFKHVQRLYEQERSGSALARADTFPARFAPDDFAALPPALCNGQVSKEMSYEENLIDWIKAARANPKSALVVFYEDLIADTPLVLNQLCHFLDLNPGPALRKAVLLHTSFAQMRDTYPPTHEFSPLDAEVKVGQAVFRFRSETNVWLNERWNVVVRISDPAYKDYAALYAAVTGRPFPFEFFQTAPVEDEPLCADITDFIARGGCFAFLRGGMDGEWRRSKRERSAKARENRYSRWI